MNENLKADIEEILSRVPGVQSVDVLPVYHVVTTVSTGEQREAVYKAEMELLNAYPKLTFEFHVKFAPSKPF